MKVPSLQGNWVDLVILIVLVYFISEAWRVGFWIILADFLGFVLSLVIALSGYSFAAGLLRQNFSLPHSVANALGFLATAGISEAILSFALIRVVKKIPYKLWKKPWTNIAATLPAFGQGLVIVSFILILTLGFPITPGIKKDISESKIGGFLVQKTSGLEAKFNEIFGELVEDSLTYLTVKPGSRESVPINAEAQELKIDEEAEIQMLELVNQERRKGGLSEFHIRSELLPVARGHAKDMWERNYFGHVSPEGDDVGDRLDKAGVSHTVAGENLALAPTVATAHNGLMNSEGHRANILEKDFKMVGIGVVDNGIYGKMFVQVFTD